MLPAAALQSGAAVIWRREHCHRQLWKRLDRLTRVRESQNLSNAGAPIVTRRAGDTGGGVWGATIFGIAIDASGDIWTAELW